MLSEEKYFRFPRLRVLRRSRRLTGIHEADVVYCLPVKKKIPQYLVDAIFLVKITYL